MQNKNNTIRYYVETIGHRWGNNSVDFLDRGRAEAEAARVSKDAFEARLYEVDVQRPGQSVLLSTYSRGVRV